MLIDGLIVFLDLSTSLRAGFGMVRDIRFPGYDLEKTNPAEAGFVY